MELQRIIWSWETITQRLVDAEPGIGRALFRSCRPIAAQRYRDGRLLVVLGCWWPEDQTFLGREPHQSRLNNALGRMLGERVVTKMARWPGGTAPALAAEGEWEQIPAPDVLRGVPEEEREEAAKCDSAIQRLFFARAYAAGLRLRCQFPQLHYRLDFAIPEKRTGADVMGWDWRAAGSRFEERAERQEQLEQHGWKIVLFSGSQVLADVDACVASLATASQDRLGPGQQPLPTRYAPEARKPFSSIGIHRPTDRGPKRPRR
ncbi:MAG: DUF559 domain-containing protein [Chloroflexi bacterium]|nr:DUF559 domain-containing protein [Chloroflexota bacterium]